MPGANRSLPPEIASKVARGSAWARSSRQAIVRARASRATGGGAVVVNSPITAIPNEPVLNPSRVGADDVLPEAPPPSLVDDPESVDERVVPDVVPPVALDVVELDRADDRRTVLAAVVVRSRRVMDDGEAERRRGHGVVTAQCLVGLPALARDHDRLGGARLLPHRNPGDGASHGVRAHARHRPHGAGLPRASRGRPTPLRRWPTRGCGRPRSSRRRGRHRDRHGPSLTSGRSARGRERRPSRCPSSAGPGSRSSASGRRPRAHGSPRRGISCTDRLATPAIAILRDGESDQRGHGGDEKRLTASPGLPRLVGGTRVRTPA